MLSLIICILLKRGHTHTYCACPFHTCAVYVFSDANNMFLLLVTLGMKQYILRQKISHSTDKKFVLFGCYGKGTDGNSPLENT